MDDMSSPAQNYSNHTQVVPAFMGTMLVLLATVIGAGVNMYKSWGDHLRMYNSSLMLALSCAVLVGIVLNRSFALKAQDRAIRAEENLRHFALTGKLLDARLSPKQIVALRFAADSEFVELARKSAEQGTEPKAIKESIQNWRADHYRA